jgi:small subunit ribosomal protein S13
LLFLKKNLKIISLNYNMNLTIFGRTLPQHKKINFALTELYGIGRSSANEIARDLGFLPTLKVKDLTEIQKIQIAKKIKNEFLVEGGLEEEIKLIVQSYMTNGSRRGYRLRNGLPVNGQRTHSNGKTARKHLHSRKQ